MKQEKPYLAVYIDDDSDMIDLVTLILNRQGFQVKGVQDGSLGVKTVQDEQPDIILLDLMMPESDGWDIFQKLKVNEFTRNIPVIILTAKAQPIDRVLGLAIAKVDGYISKPFHPQELIDCVKKVLNIV